MVVLNFVGEQAEYNHACMHTWIIDPIRLRLVTIYNKDRTMKVTNVCRAALFLIMC